MAQKIVMNLVVKVLGDNSLEGVTNNGVYFVISQMESGLIADLFNDGIKDNNDAYIETIQSEHESVEAFVEDIKGYVLM